ERIPLGGRANEGALIDPLALDELKLPLQVGADEEEEHATLRSIILQDPLGQDRAVGLASTKYAMAPDLEDFILEVVARVHTPDMGAQRAFEALRIIVVVQEIVVVLWVSGQRGIIALGSEGERRATAPAAHDLGC